MKFSERHGHIPVRETFQTDSMDATLRNGLWNAFYIELTQHLDLQGGKKIYDLNNNRRLEEYDVLRRIIVSQLIKEPLNNWEQFSEDYFFKELKKRFFAYEWYVVYDFLESVANIKMLPKLKFRVNSFLKQELAGYRMIDGHITPITDTAEVEALNTALMDPAFPGVQEHLRTALSLLSQRPEPDLRNSCKESITAVESMCRQLTGEAAFGKALAILERQYGLPTDLKSTFNTLYGWSNGDDGIRHPLMKTPDLTVDLTKFILLTCTSFVNYLKTLERKTTI